MDKKWVVYILQCADGTLYTGITDDLSRRIAAHGTPKGAKYTRGRGPFQLRYVEPCPDHSMALKRELQIKGLTKEKKRLLCMQYARQTEDENAILFRYSSNHS